MSHRPMDKRLLETLDTVSQSASLLRLVLLERYHDGDRWQGDAAHVIRDIHTQLDTLDHDFAYLCHPSGGH